MLGKVKRKIRKAVSKCAKTEYVTVPVSQGDILKGKTVLITGGGSGIGLSIAKACAANKANVIICGRTMSKLEEARTAIGGNTEAFNLDISDSDKMRDGFESIINNTKFGKIDILINNAGISKGEPFPNTNADDLKEVIKTNVIGTYTLSEVFAKYLISNHICGNILNIASVSGNRPAISPYMVSKWSEMGFTKGFAKSLIKHGIVVNCIAPGPTASGMLLEKSGGDLSYDKSPSGRYVTAEEIANLAVFLTSSMGRMIVGETIYITGGCGTLTFDDIEY
ncbi:SDR family oxidoreductase [Ruminococcus flavefaciens]|uniref:SDR family oxidoreductase n=1 Tax=Ruminococcus flavefaciens TaxID=1265 RepID=UPI0004B6DB99|nr:SDR family oxidoreductase [Ruminococcus flavefaciens]